MTVGPSALRRVSSSAPVAPLPTSDPETPVEHQREHVESAGDVLPRSVQLSVAVFVSPTRIKFHLVALGLYRRGTDSMTPEIGPVRPRNPTSEQPDN